ncbi:MAG: hypothetical protein CL910_09905 [Deltaproteobacteria bacterium]|nr:hypothetical protein [Deltaproteobacteria bacterium]
METARWLLFPDHPGFAFLLALFLGSTAVTLAALAFVAIARRTPPAFRHGVLFAALVGVLLLPLFELVLPTWEVAVLPASNDRVLVSDLPAQIGADLSSRRDSTSAPPRRTNRIALSKNTAARRDAPKRDASRTPRRATLSTRAVRASAWRIDTFDLVALLWALVALLLLIRLVTGALRLNGWARRAGMVTESPWNLQVESVRTRLGIHRRIDVFADEGIGIPATWGFLRPVVLLPVTADTWPAARRRSVLFHELAHVRRFDCLTQFVARFVCAVFWFNPLVWIVERRLRHEREGACDDHVLRSGVRASAYAADLLEVVQASRTSPTLPRAAVALSRLSGLERRLRWLLRPAGPSGPGVVRTTIVSAALIGLVGTVASVRLVPASPNAPQAPVVATNPDPCDEPDRVLDTGGRPVDVAEEEGRPDTTPARHPEIEELVRKPAPEPRPESEPAGHVVPGSPAATTVAPRESSPNAATRPPLPTHQPPLERERARAPDPVLGEEPRPDHVWVELGRAEQRLLHAHLRPRNATGFLRATYNFGFETRDDQAITRNQWDVLLDRIDGRPWFRALSREIGGGICDLGPRDLATIDPATLVDLKLAPRAAVTVGTAYALHTLRPNADYWVLLKPFAHLQDGSVRLIWRIVLPKQVPGRVLRPHGGLFPVGMAALPSDLPLTRLEKRLEPVRLTPHDRTGHFFGRNRPGRAGDLVVTRTSHLNLQAGPHSRIWVVGPLELGRVTRRALRRLHPVTSTPVRFGWSYAIRVQDRGRDHLVRLRIVAHEPGGSVRFVWADMAP